MAAATAIHRRLSQQNPYKTRVSLVELGRFFRHCIVHFEAMPNQKFLRCKRCAEETEHNGMTFSGKHKGPRTKQQMNVPTTICLDS